jgi:hypothetical protein
MQTTIAISKSFKSKFKKAKIQAQSDLKKELTDEAFIKLLITNHSFTKVFVGLHQKIGEKCGGCAEIIETDKHYCKHGSCYTR